MNPPLKGGCLCGYIRYEYHGEAGPSSYCHCDDCKRATGGPYTVGVLSETSKLRILSGNVKGHTAIADSGRKITREFCPECGSPLFTRAEKLPDKVFIKAGSLDKPGVVTPGFHTWTERAVAWAYPQKGLPEYSQGGPG
jgi:hypothetical protein